MSDPGTLELDEPTFTGLRDRIQSYSGIYLDDSRRRSLTRVISSRLTRRGLRTWKEYLALLDSSSGPEEIASLLEEVVNNETTFFRNPRHFRLLAEVLLPELDRTRPANLPLRLWSAGCSTGQEPYSLAITAAEVFGLPPRRPVQILATDISRRALDYARRGLYTQREMQRVELPYQRNHFQAEDHAFRVRQELRDLILFQEVNLVTSPLPPLVRGVDVIFCRNVTIYFQVETSRRLMADLHHCLNDGGYLFIGFSETLWQVFDAFERVQNGGVFFYRKAPAQRAGPAAGPLHRPPPPAPSVERPLYLGTAGPRPAEPAPQVRRPATRGEQPGRAHYHQGLACLRDGAYEQAQDAFRAALQEEPSLVEAYCGLAQVHANQGRYPEALRACEKALEVDDLAEEAYLLRGLVHRQMGKIEQAIADLERATYLNPTSPTAHFHLGNIFLVLPDPARALQSFRRTWRALQGRTEETLIDGVPAYLLRRACEQHMEALTSKSGRPARN
jgi:chemotaxis protein methyltransferase CheR